MRTIATLLTLCIALVISSCSKQPIEDEAQANLNEILIGTWNVGSVTYRFEQGTFFESYTSTAQNGSFTFTPDSTHHLVSFDFKRLVGEDLVPDTRQVDQHGLYAIINDDEIDVDDQSSGTFFRYQTVNRTPNTMTLIYQEKDLDLATGIRTVDRYTFKLTKAQ